MDMEEHGGKYEDGEVLHVERSMVPDETLKELKSGDVLEFRVVNPNEEGGLISVVYNMPAKTSMSGQREGEEEMTKDFGEYMSARNNEEGEGGMSQPTGGY